MRRRRGEQQQLGLARDAACHREARRLFAQMRKRKPDARHREQAEALIVRPGLAEARVERGGHHAGDQGEVGDGAVSQIDADPRAHARGRAGWASGARP